MKVEKWPRDKVDIEIVRVGSLLYKQWMNYLTILSSNPISIIYTLPPHGYCFFGYLPFLGSMVVSEEVVHHIAGCSG